MLAEGHAPSWLPSIAADDLIMDAVPPSAIQRPIELPAAKMKAGNGPARAVMIGFLEKLFSEIRCDRWLLEHDSERAGTFEPLRFMPQDRTVVLGLITTKSGALERRDDVLRRVDEANRFVSLERFALRPPRESSNRRRAAEKTCFCCFIGTRGIGRKKSL